MVPKTKIETITSEANAKRPSRHGGCSGTNDHGVLWLSICVSDFDRLTPLRAFAPLLRTYQCVPRHPAQMRIRTRTTKCELSMGRLSCACHRAHDAKVALLSLGKIRQRAEAVEDDKDIAESHDKYPVSMKSGGT